MYYDLFVCRDVRSSRMQRDALGRDVEVIRCVVV